MDADDLPGDRSGAPSMRDVASSAAVPPADARIAPGAGGDGDVVLEKHADFFRDFRGDTVHPSTLQMMDDTGADRTASLKIRISEASRSTSGRLVRRKSSRSAVAYQPSERQTDDRLHAAMGLPQLHCPRARQTVYPASGS